MREAWAAEAVGVWRGGSTRPFHTLGGFGLPDARLHTPAVRRLGLSALRDAQGQSSTGRDVAGLSPHPGALRRRDTELHDPPTPSPRSLAFLAKTVSFYKRNSGVSVLMKRPCLSVSVYRARRSPVPFQRLRLLSINNERGSEYIQRFRVWRSGGTLEPLQGQGGWEGGSGPGIKSEIP